MYLYANDLKGNVAALLDTEVSDVGEVSLVVAINNFLAIPVSFEEALSVYAALLGMKGEGGELISEPLRNRFQSEMRDLSPTVVMEKMHDFSDSIRKILVDSIASSLCRQHDALLEHVRLSVCSNSADELLALADKAVMVVPETNATKTSAFCLIGI